MLKSKLNYFHLLLKYSVHNHCHAFVYLMLLWKLPAFYLSYFHCWAELASVGVLFGISCLSKRINNIYYKLHSRAKTLPHMVLKWLFPCLLVLYDQLTRISLWLSCGCSSFQHFLVLPFFRDNTYTPSVAIAMFRGDTWHEMPGRT